MGGLASKLVDRVVAKWKAASAAASAALVTITEAAEAAKTNMAGLFDAATSTAASSYGAVKRATADASRSVVELVRRLFGGDAAAAAKRNLEEVVQVLRAGASSASSALAAAQETCLAVVPISVRKVVAALSEFGSCLAELAASSAADAMALVRSIADVEELLGFSIPTEARIPIAIVAVAVDLYLIFYCSPAGAAAGVTMKAPGGGGLMILRSAFEANPKLYFSTLRSAGPAAVATLF